MSEEDRRRTKRRPIEFSVTLEEGGRTAEGTVQDVSAGGVFVRTKNTFESGTLVVLSSTSPQGESFAFGAKVVRVFDGDDAGMGLSFTDVGPTALRGIHQYLIAGQRVSVSEAVSQEPQSEGEA